jgi:hypothetical protein
MEKYYALKKDVQNVEVLRRGAETMMREIAPERTAMKARGHYKLREDVRSVEVLRRSAEGIMLETPPERTAARERDMGL